MYRKRRVVAAHEIGVSTFDRCIGAKINAPVLGIFSRPLTLSRKYVRHKATRIPRITA